MSISVVDLVGWFLKKSRRTDSKISKTLIFLCILGFYNAAVSMILTLKATSVNIYERQNTILVYRIQQLALLLKAIRTREFIPQAAERGKTKILHYSLTGIPIFVTFCICYKSWFVIIQRKELCFFRKKSQLQYGFSKKARIAKISICDNV